jgi:hypothetical protein
MIGLGSHISNFVGACSRWTWGQIRFKFFGGPKFTFNEYMNGPKNGDEIIDTYGHGCINHVVGIIILTIILLTFVNYVIW